MHEWQLKLINNLCGIKKHNMQIIMSGRRVGKSYMAQMWNQVYVELAAPAHKIVSKAEVDGRTWYTIKCNKAVADWVRQSPGEGNQWYEHIDHNWVLDRTMFDVHEEFYMMLKLKWGA